jgi:hypothetical protein
MKNGFVCLLACSLAFMWAGTSLAAKDMPNGAHYNLNLIGVPQCTKKTEKFGDCFNGNAGDIQTKGHTIFVPLVTDWIENPCTTDENTWDYESEIEVGDVQKGVRILVADADQMQVIDRDATDGTAKFNLPYGSYAVYARALGKPGGCMDINTLICYDEVETDVFVPADCREDLTNDPNDQYVLVGHVDVDRSSRKPKWQNVSNDLLNVATGASAADYLDFFWQVTNNNLKLLQIRFYPD